MAVLVLSALVAYAVQSVAWPLHAGRDVQDYLIHSIDLWSADPVYPAVLLFRGPLAPLLVGTPLDLLGTAPTEVALALAYAGAVLALVAAAATWGRAVAIATGIALLAYPAYGSLFHLVASEPVFALGIALWTLAVVRTAATPTATRFAFLGVAVFLLTLTRPSSQILLLFAAFPLALRQEPLRRRLAWSGAFLATAGALLVSWAAVNAIRLDDFAVSRNVGANYPLFRLFTFDRLVRPENGPASRKLARAIETDLLPFEPYRSRQVDVDEFFASGAVHRWSDLAPLADRRWGWDEDYRTLYAVAAEAIRRHPSTYARRVAATVRHELTVAATVAAPRRDERTVGGPAFPEAGSAESRERLWWLATTPDGRIVPDWRGPEEPGVRFLRAGDRARAERLERELERLLGLLPARDGSRTVARILNRVTELHPPMLFWILLGFAGLLVRRVRSAPALVFMPVLGLVVVVASLLGEPPITAFRVPFDPLFMLFGIAGAFGASDGLRPWVESARASFRRRRAGARRGGAQRP